jgi:hypothetical protein
LNNHYVVGAMHGLMLGAVIVAAIAVVITIGIWHFGKPVDRRARPEFRDICADAVLRNIRQLEGLEVGHNDPVIRAYAQDAKNCVRKLNDDLGAARRAVLVARKG